MKKFIFHLRPDFLLVDLRDFSDLGSGDGKKRKKNLKMTSWLVIFDWSFSELFFKKALKMKKSSENDQLTGHFQSFQSFFFHFQSFFWYLQTKQLNL